MSLANIGDALICAKSALKFASTLRENQQSFKVELYYNNSLFENQMVDVLRGLVEHHHLHTCVDVVTDCQHSPDIYIRPSFGHCHTEVENTFTQDTRTFGAQLDDCERDYNVVYDLRLFSLIHAPLWAAENELYRRVMRDVFDIDSDSLYSFDTFGARVDRQKKHNILVHLSERGSSLRMENSKFVDFIREYSKVADEMPRVTFTVHKNIDNVRAVAASIDNDVELVEMTLFDLSRHMRDNVDLVITNSCGVLHVAGAFGVKTVELSNTDDVWHPIRWQPPSCANSHFLVSAFPGWERNINFERAANGVVTWMSDDSCLMSHINSGMRLTHDTICKSLCDEVTVHERCAYTMTIDALYKTKF
ncbi:hypothetical protein MYOV011v1_p0307 [Vibrio phage 6E35.1a]|nr:hypothetical protein MYOV011v1_p0307 [Vibrio phage 6E35.1a]